LRSDSPYLIAEIGLNHNGNLDLACQMTLAARGAGAHAAKFQLYDSKHFIHPGAKLGDGLLSDFFGQFELSPDDWRKLADFTRAQGLDFFCSVFDFQSVELYATLKPRLIKIASCDMTNRPLIEYAAKTIPDAPLFISTGTASESEVSELVKWSTQNIKSPIVLFQCVSCYPSKPEDYNLRLVPEWKSRYGVPVGVSDHTEGIGVSVATATLGAVAVERHFTISHDLPGPDQKISLEPSDFAAMSRAVTEALRSLGDGEKRNLPCEEGPRKFGRRAAYLVREKKAGDSLSGKDLLFMRPGVEGPGPEFVFEGRRLRIDKDALDSIGAGDLL